MNAFFIFLIILLILILIGLMPLKLDVCINDDNNSHVIFKFFLFKFNLIPSKNKKIDKKEKKDDNIIDNEKKEYKKEEEKKKDDKDNKLLKNLSLLKDIIYPIKKFLIRFKNGIIIKDFEIVWGIVRDDAAKTAIFYGRITSVFYPLLSFLKEVFNFKIKQVNIYPDFFNEKSSFYLSFHLKFRLYKLVFMSLALLFSVLLNIIKSNRRSNNLKIKEK